MKIFVKMPSTFSCIMSNLLSAAVGLPLHRAITAWRESHSHRIKTRSFSTWWCSVCVHCARGHCTLWGTTKQLKQEQYLRTPNCHGPLLLLQEALILVISEEPICCYRDKGEKRIAGSSFSPFLINKEIKSEGELKELNSEHQVLRKHAAAPAPQISSKAEQQHLCTAHHPAASNITF